MYKWLIKNCMCHEVGFSISGQILYYNVSFSMHINNNDNYTHVSLNKRL